MKRAVAFFSILAVAVAGLYLSQRRREPTAVSPNAIVDIAADLQRDMARAPLELTRLPDHEEIRIGDRLAAGYAPSGKTLSPEEEATLGYIERTGATIAAHAHRRLPYSFHLIADHATVNAFSLPGGHVYLGQGLLDQMETEDQLASVLAHEIEHIDHYHCAERVQLEAQLGHFRLDAAGALLAVPLAVWQAGYNKDQELEADREGLRLAVAAGYSPWGSVTLFKKFGELRNERGIQAENPALELGQLAQESLRAYFRSHPEPSERLAQVQAIIREEHWEDRRMEKPLRIAYQVRNGRLVK